MAHLERDGCRIVFEDSIRAATGVRVPLLDISSSVPRANVAPFRELCPDLVHGQVAGSGHFVELEVPE